MKSNVEVPRYDDNEANENRQISSTLEVEYVVFPHFTVSFKLIATITLVVESTIFTKASFMHSAPSMPLINSLFLPSPRVALQITMSLRCTPHLEQIVS